MRSAHIRTVVLRQTRIQTLLDAVPLNTIGAKIERIVTDAASTPQRPLSHKLRVLTAGQRRSVTSAIKCQTRRSAVEPVIGHNKSEY